jgi:GntR family transcriptional regulator, transcriptional repressor for pyruvate dehydrogenase complex
VSVEVDGNPIVSDGPARGGRPDTTTPPLQGTLGAPPVAREFPTPKRTSVSLEAAEAIKALIVSGELGSGDALPPERNLATMLGISRPSVREALRVLTAMNVVEPRHGGGTYVTSLDPTLLAQPINFLLQVEPHTFLHLFEVRQVLEVSAARLAAPKITEDGLAELQSLVDQVAAAMRQPNRYSELDFQLHTKIVEAMENPIYLSLYQSISDLLLESRRRTAAIATVRRQAHQDHVAIVGALRARDPEAAAQAMQEHLDTLRRVLDDMLAPQVRQ